MKSKKLVCRLLSAAAVFLLLSVCLVYFPGTDVYASSNNGSTTPTSADTGEIEVSIAASADKVKLKGSFDLTITINNTSSYPISDISFKLNYDTSRLGIAAGFVKFSEACYLRTEDGYMDIIFSANEESDLITAGEKKEIRITYIVSDNNKTSDACVFSISEASAYNRKDLSVKNTSSENTSHTFTFKRFTDISVNIDASDADLIALIPSVNGADLKLTPEFSPDVTNYTLTVSYSVPDFAFRWTKSDPNATIERQFPGLSVGDNEYKFTVTSADKTATKTYTVIVRRLKEGETTARTNGSPSSSTTTRSTVSGSDTTTTTSTTTTTTTSTTTTTEPEIILDEETEPDDYIDPFEGEDTPDQDKGLTLSLGTLLGLVGFQLLLFGLAFLSGFLSHKNASAASTPTLNDIIEASQIITTLAAQSNMLPGQQPMAAIPPQEVIELPADAVQPAEGAQENQLPQYYDVPTQPSTSGYGDYGQYYSNFVQPRDEEERYSAEAIQEFNPDEQYDEYGYNAKGESNYKGEEPPANTNIYYQ